MVYKKSIIKSQKMKNINAPVDSESQRQMRGCFFVCFCLFDTFVNLFVWFVLFCKFILIDRNVPADSGSQRRRTGNP